VAKTSGTLGRIASKTVAAGREHVAKVLLGEETLPEAAGAAVEDLLSGAKAKSAPKTASKKSTVKRKTSAQKKFVAKKGSTRKKA
jgi:hypothetical protein